MDDEPPLHVTRYDRAARYLVRSQRCGIGHYMVDLGDPAFPKGRCSCTDFDVRIEFPLKNELEPERLTCVHINAVNALLEHARMLCEAAGIPFSPLIIPTYERTRI